MKQKCCKCNKFATWIYEPGHSICQPEDNYFCDDCVSRGCSCYLFGEFEEIRDSKGRLMPCMEFREETFGFEDIDVDWEEFDTWSERLTDSQIQELYFSM